MSGHIHEDELDVAVFMAELIGQRLDDVAVLERDYKTVTQLANPALKRAAIGAFRLQVGEVCAEVGELALDLPNTEEIANELYGLKGPTKAALLIARSVVQYGVELVEVMPFAAAAINEKAAEITRTLEESRPDLTPEAQKRLDSLEAIDAVLSRPINSDFVVNGLIGYFDNKIDKTAEKVNLIEQLHECLSAPELARQLTETDPRSRLYEYCEAFCGYPVELTTLAMAVYLHDSREPNKKKHIMATVLNPKQRAGATTSRDLAAKNIVLQHGWIMDDSAVPSSPRRIIRSLNAEDYKEERHVGAAIVSTTHYEWESIDETVLQKAKKS